MLHLYLPLEGAARISNGLEVTILVAKFLFWLEVIVYVVKFLPVTVKMPHSQFVSCMGLLNSAHVFLLRGGITLAHTPDAGRLCGQILNEVWQVYL